MAHKPFEPTIAGVQIPPPYDCTGLKAFGFPLLADIQPLQDLCNDFLAIAPASEGISFEPIRATGPLIPPDTCIVIMQAIDYLSLNPRTPPWDDFGGAPQREVYFAVPVVQKQGGVPVDVGILIPYIFVDSQVSALTGREVLGLPKLLASFNLPRSFPSSPIVVRFEGRKTKGAPFQLDDLVSVSSILLGSIPPLSLGVRIGMFFGPLDVLFAGSEFFTLIANAHTNGSFFGFSSRMLIDPTSPSTDVYQSILRCTYTTTNIMATGLLPPVSVTLSPFLELDMEKTLGIRSVNGKVWPINPSFVECDLTLDGPKTLWES